MNKYFLFACMYNYTDAIEYMIKNYKVDLESGLCVAGTYSNFATMILLIDKGATVTETYCKSIPPVMIHFLRIKGAVVIR